MHSKEQPPHINVDYFEDLTGDIAQSHPQSVEEIGKKLRTIREERGLSIDELADLTGFDSDLLAKIENQAILPQLGTMVKLSKALDSAFSCLISGEGNKPYSITRMKDQKVVSRSTSLKGQKHIYTYKGLAPEVSGRSMEPLIVQLQENPDREVSIHDGEEFIYVLNGTVLLSLGDEQFELEPGDSAYYQATIPHWLASKTNLSTILAVIYEG